jgi:alkylation response protein AidB-like acyl-CoA dehydrogenase
VSALWREVAASGWVAAVAGADGHCTGAAAVLFAELGRAACPLPLLGSWLLAGGLGGAPATLRDSLLAAVAAGEAVPAVALGEASDRGGGAAVLERGDVGATIRGRLRFVEGAPLASHLLISVEPGPCLAVIEAAGAGVVLRPTPGMAVPALADVELDRVTPVAAWEVAAAEVSDLVLLGRLACSARALGAAQRAFELATEHARTRQQFGSPIGRFQAVQHRLADCLTLLDASRLLTSRAATSRDVGAPTWRHEVAAATAFAGPSLRRIVREVQHVLAGVGYIEEHEAPRHFRRVYADTLRFGGAQAGRAELAAFLLDR